MRLGIADHFGWAVAVTAGSDGEVVDRRRIELVEAGVCAAPVHYEGTRLGVDGTSDLVRQVRASVVRATAAALDELEHALPEPLLSVSLRRWPPGFPEDIATQLRSPYEARADAVMYRQLFAELAIERGWAVHLYDAKTVLDLAAGVLGDRAESVLQVPRARLGPPWAKDHRVALAAAIVAGADAPD